jgi:ABC-type branched-subunit amino acid transport system ATPase component
MINITTNDNSSDISLSSEIELRIHIKSLMANDETDAHLPNAGVTCVVGANNVGKSQFLRDIMAYFYMQKTFLQMVDQ